MLTKFTCLVLATLLVGAVADQAKADSQRAYVHPLTNLPPGGDISTGFYFPDHPDKKFPAGEKIKVVLGLHNDGSEAYNLTAIMGSLNHPEEFRIFYQNFTQQFYLQPLASNDEATVEYTFRPDASVPARQFVIALTLFYQDTKGSFLSSTFFNQTIEIVEPQKLVDTDMIMMYLTLLALLGLAAYGIHQYLMSLGVMKKKTKSKSKVNYVPHVQDNADEWIEGTRYHAMQKEKEKKLSKRNIKA